MTVLPPIPRNAPKPRSGATFRIHAIVCSYLGDGELDIGKTAGWLNTFVDTTFFYVLQYGEAAAKYSIDYAKTFPDAQFAYHPVSQPAFFLDPGNFRQMGYEAAKAAWQYEDNDWVIFVDASESLSVDVPSDQLLPLEDSFVYKYLYDEAEAATGDVLALRWYVFLNQGTVTEQYMAADLDLAQAIIAERQALEDELAGDPPPDPSRVLEIEARLAELATMEVFNNSVLYWTCTPRYEAVPSSDQLVRFFRSGAADTVEWDAMDDIAEAASAPDAVHVAIVSYGYGRFVPDVPDVDDWTEEADVGFANRLLLQQYLPQRGVALPEDYTADDPAGVVATAPSDLLSLAYCYYVDQFDTGDGDPDFQQFTALWRRNPRDGVWYVNYTLGPVPIDPLSGDPAVPLVVWEGQQPYTTGPPGTGNP